MPRKKAAQAAADGPTTPTVAAGQAVQSDQAPAEDCSSDPARPDAPPQQPRPVDPFPFRVTSLTDTRDGPKARLFRNNKYQQVAISFDEKPSPEIISQLRDAGFRWRGQDKVWAKNLDREAKWQTQAAAEELFDKITNEIRRANGCGNQIG